MKKLNFVLSMLLLTTGSTAYAADDDAGKLTLEETKAAIAELEYLRTRTADDAISAEVLDQIQDRVLGQTAKSAVNKTEDNMIEPIYSFDKAYFETLDKEVVASEDYIYWEQFAPGNAGYSEGVHMHSTDPNTFYNLPDMKNRYVTFDQGNHFVSMNDINESSKSNPNPGGDSGIDFSHQDENFGFAAGSGLWLTTNKGLSWTKLTTGGAPTSRVGDVAVDPTDDNIWLAGTGKYWDVKRNHYTKAKPHGVNPIGAAGLYKSSDKGVTWGKLTETGIPGAATFGQILFNPFNTQEVYAGTSYGLYKSVDGGRSFKKLDIDGDGLVDPADANDLVHDFKLYIDHENKSIQIVAIHQIDYFLNDETKSLDQTGGIMRSYDGGETWENITGDLGLNLAEVNEETIKIVDPTGETNPGNFVNAWYWTPNFIGRYFSGTEKYPSKNTTEVRNAIKAEYPNYPTNYIPTFDRIVIDPTNPDRIYISHNAAHATSMRLGEVWGTADGGKTWDILTRTGYGWGESAEYWEKSGKVQEGADLSKPNVTYHHAGDAYYYHDLYSTQGARDLDIALDGTVFVMFRSLVKSTDGGKTWEQTDVKYREDGSMTGTGGSNLPGGGILTDPRDPDLMYLVSGENSLFQVVDKGEGNDPAYIKHLPNSPESAADIAISPADINTMYMTIMRQYGAGEFFRSTDAGQTWESISSPLVGKTANINNKSVGTMVIDPSDPKTILFTVSNGLLHETSGGRNPETEHLGVWKSTDGGYTWAQKNEGLPTDAWAYQLLFDPRDPNILYAGMPYSKSTITDPERDKNSGVGMYVSYDKAETWELLSGLPKAVTQVNDINIDPLGNLYIAAGTSSFSVTGSPAGTAATGGVWVLKNGSTIWQKIFEGRYVTLIEFDQNHPNRLLVSNRPSDTSDSKVINNGVYISENFGNTWKKANTNIGNATKIYDLKFDSQDPQIIWATSQSGGFYKGYISELDPEALQ